MKYENKIVITNGGNKFRLGEKIGSDYIIVEDFNDLNGGFEGYLFPEDCIEKEETMNYEGKIVLTKGGNKFRLGTKIGSDYMVVEDFSDLNGGFEGYLFPQDCIEKELE